MTYIGWVCEKCHKKDENVTKCQTLLKGHTSTVYGTCDICGKKEATCFCINYVTLCLGNFQEL